MLASDLSALLEGNSTGYYSLQICRMLLQCICNAGDKLGIHFFFPLKKHNKINEVLNRFKEATHTATARTLK